MKRGRAYSTLICTGLSTSRGSYPLKIEIVFPYGFTVRVSYKRCTLFCFAFIPPCLVSSKLRDQVDVANVTDSIQGRIEQHNVESQAKTLAAPQERSRTVEGTLPSNACRKSNRKCVFETRRGFSPSLSLFTLRLFEPFCSQWSGFVINTARAALVQYASQRHPCLRQSALD